MNPCNGGRGPLAGPISWSCNNADDIANFAGEVLKFLPGYDCYQTTQGATALNAGLCVIDLVPGLGKADEIAAGVKYLDDLAPRLDDGASQIDDVIGAACSFSASTLVQMANGTRIPIADVKVGDQVLATDPETGETGAREVIATLPHTDQLLTLKTSSGEVVTTEDHKYWNATDSEWQESQRLDPGDRLLSADGDEVTVEGLDWTTVHTDDAYDLTIDDLHTFYVGAGDEAVLVHNACLSPNQMNNAIKGGKAPRGLKRVDTGKVPGEQTHIHFDDGAALNMDGTWKHGSTTITSKQAKWLVENGWVLP